VPRARQVELDDGPGPRRDGRLRTIFERFHEKIPVVLKGMRRERKAMPENGVVRTRSLYADEQSAPPLSRTLAAFPE
jgi:hypothetical protein